MDIAIHLALAAVIRGLRRSGTIDGRGVSSIVFELRAAADEAMALLHDHDAVLLARLADEIAIDDGQLAPMPPPRATGATLRIG